MTGETGVVMDIPSAWKWTEESKMEDHHERCSWRTHRMLCDCRVLWDEYDRRKALLTGSTAKGADTKHGEQSGLHISITEAKE